MYTSAVHAQFHLLASSLSLFSNSTGLLCENYDCVYPRKKREKKLQNKTKQSKAKAAKNSFIPSPSVGSSSHRFHHDSPIFFFLLLLVVLTIHRFIYVTPAECTPLGNQRSFSNLALFCGNNTRHSVCTNHHNHHHYYYYYSKSQIGTGLKNARSARKEPMYKFVPKIYNHTWRNFGLNTCVETRCASQIAQVVVAAKGWLLARLRELSIPFADVSYGCTYTYFQTDSHSMLRAYYYVAEDVVIFLLACL